MDTIFGAAWQDLTPDDVERFLDENREESLTWDAKGTTLPRPDSIRKHACGFANRIGGFLILGASEGDAGWTLDGVEFPNAEPETWLLDIVAALRPAPVAHARAWPVGDRVVAVLRVQPVGQPPCMTTGGVVYERVSGQTLPVTEPTALDRLFSRGEAARDRARKAALETTDHLINSVRHWATNTHLLALALSATGQPHDAATRPFREDLVTLLNDSMLNRLHVGPIRTGQWAWVEQEHVTTMVAGHEFAWTAQMTRSTTAAIMFRATPEDGSVQQLCEQVIPMGWKYAADRMVDLGGEGDARLEIFIDGTHPAITVAHDIRIGRWTGIRHPTDGEVASVARELRRAVGEHAFEAPPTE
jgi:hypothetical protein